MEYSYNYMHFLSELLFAYVHAHVKP